MAKTKTNKQKKNPPKLTILYLGKYVGNLSSFIFILLVRCKIVELLWKSLEVS